MIQTENTKQHIMKIQSLYFLVFQVMVLVFSSGLAVAGPDGVVESTEEVTYTDAPSSDIKDITEWVRNKFAGERKIESLDVEAISYTSSEMEAVFKPGSFYVHITVNGQRSPGMVMCRTDSGIDMLPGRHDNSPDLVTPQHLKKSFSITSKEDAIFFHKALAHFYDRGDPNFSSNREADKSEDIWTLTDTLESSTKIGYKVKVSTDGKVLEVSKYFIFPEES